MTLKRLTAVIIAYVFAFSCIGPVSGFAAIKSFETDTIIEAEDGSFRSEYFKVKTSYASGGEYIYSKIAGVTDAEKIKTDDISFLININEEGEYRSLLRAFIKSANGTKLFYRYDSNEWKTVSIPLSTDFAWVELGVETLTPGTHKLQLYKAATDLWLDALYVTDNMEIVPEVDESVEPIPVNAAPDLTYTHTQESMSMSKPGIIIEAEDITYTAGSSVLSDITASGGKCIKCSVTVEDRTTPDAGSPAHVKVEVEVTEDGTYIPWVRIRAASSGNDSFFVSVNDGAYKLHNIVTVSENFGWEKPFSSINAKAGDKITLNIRARESDWDIDQIVISSKTSFVPRGIVTDLNAAIPKLESRTELPPVNPPAEHPRVLIRRCDVPELLEKYNHPENAEVRETLESYVEEGKTTGIKITDAYSTDTLSRIEANAYYYVLFGDKEAGRAAVDGIFALENWPEMGTSINDLRAYGRMVMSGGIVYDWCYDLLSESEKYSLIDLIISWEVKTEHSWPPNVNGFTIQGHAAEGDILRDALTFAIATYDERPDIWEYVGGMFYEWFVPERAWHHAAQMNHQGSQYGSERQRFSMYAHELITGMGFDPPYDTYDTGAYMYCHSIYQRRPDGNQFQDGDDWDIKLMNYMMENTHSLLLSLHLTRDPYIKDELIRTSHDSNKKGIYTSVPGEAGVAQWLIFFEPEVETKSIANLPLSRYFGSPMGVMYARTGWDEGVNAPTVAAEMKINEWYFGNHDHKDSGSFQIYYKGPLATESGFYQYNELAYGSPNHMGYAQQTIAHNSILVYDPYEPKSNFLGADGGVNDGGQKGAIGATSWKGEYIMSHPEIFKQCNVDGHEIDPQNPITPDYTYIKGDLTNAYSSKVQDLKRSMMFLNLKDSKIPAAMIVFDKVTSSKPDFKKTWLLHGQDVPEITGSRSIWKSTPYESDNGERYTGKMIADRLLPTEANTELVGNPEDGFSIVNGVNIYHPATDPAYEQNTYRLEISESGKETTYFLNCLQVTDEGNMVYLNPTLLENEDFYGVKLADRAVYFSKSGERLDKKITLTSDGSNLKYTVCDVAAGSYKIIADGEEITKEVTEDGGVLSFETAAKNITAERTGDYEEKEKEEIELNNEKRYYIVMGTQIAGIPVAAKLVNDKLVVPVTALAKKMGINVENGFLKKIFTDESQRITVIAKDKSNILTVNGENIEMTNPAYYENGELMVELRPFAESFNFIVNYDDLYGIVGLANNKVIVRSDMVGYATIKGYKNDDGSVDVANKGENMYDGDLATLWAAEGTGRYVDFEFEKEEMIENVEIIFNPNSRRTPDFEIQVSEDGENFRSVYVGKGSPDADGYNWEVFKFDPNDVVKAKVVRYIGNGSDKSLWNGVKEIKFKLAQPLIKWEDKAEYAKVISAANDGGEIDGENVAPNLIDNNSRTIWAAQGLGRYAQFELENNESIKGVEIVFNPNSKRTAKFEIQISEDGENFETIYKGQSDPNVEENTLERFEFSKTYNAKYVRYVGNGSNISLWNGVKEIRVIKGN